MVILEPAPRARRVWYSHLLFSDSLIAPATSLFFGPSLPCSYTLSLAQTTGPFCLWASLPRETARSHYFHLVVLPRTGLTTQSAGPPTPIDAFRHFLRHPSLLELRFNLALAGAFKSPFRFSWPPRRKKSFCSSRPGIHRLAVHKAPTSVSAHQAVVFIVILETPGWLSDLRCSLPPVRGLVFWREKKNLGSIHRPPFYFSGALHSCWISCPIIPLF